MTLQSIKNKQGFTLIELMVSVFIISFMSIMYVGAFRYAGQKSAVSVSANKLASDIRRVQSDALGLKDRGGSPPLGGWGIEFRDGGGREKYYIIFTDDNNPSGNQRMDGAEAFETIYYKGAIEARKSLRKQDNSILNNRNRVWITYEPPDPKIEICIWTGDCGYQELAIPIQSIDGSQVKYVVVNKYGLVDVQDSYP